MRTSLRSNGLAITATLPLFIGYYLQDGVFTKKIAKVTSNIPVFIQDVDARKLIGLIAPYLVALFLLYISGIMSAYSVPMVELQVVEQLVDQLIESIRTTKKQININELIMHLKKVAETKHIYKLFIAHIIPTVVVLFILIYNFMKCDTRAGIKVVCILVLLILVTIWIERQNIDGAYKTEEQQGAMYDRIHDTMLCIDTVITSDTKAHEIDQIKQAKKMVQQMASRSEQVNINATYGLQGVCVGAVIGINYIAWTLHRDRKMDTSVLVSIVLVSLLFVDYYNYSINAIMDMMATIGKICEASDYFATFQIRENRATKRLVFSRGDIQYRDVGIRMGTKTICDHFNAQIPCNAITGFVGKIGSGKTTLLRVIAGITEYTGAVYVDGQDLRQCTHSSIVRHIAYIPQHPKLFNQSILYNLSYGTSFTEPQIWERIHEYGVGAMFDGFDKKLHTMVGKEGARLSGGQKQMIYLIRSLVQDKQIILLDEPTSSLDPINKGLLIGLLEKLKTHKTILLSSHDTSLIKVCDKIIQLPIYATPSTQKHPVI
jgi:ABC-type multidrug transport system fused ATPase/permease subunit